MSLHVWFRLFQLASYASIFAGHWGVRRFSAAASELRPPPGAPSLSHLGGACRVSRSAAERAERQAEERLADTAESRRALQERANEAEARCRTWVRCSSGICMTPMPMPTEAAPTRKVSR